MKQEHITLRCDDGAEAAVFTKYTHHILDKEDDSVTSNEELIKNGEWSI